jgi:GMP synthase (glutamine-hydrolysing)
MAEANNQPGIAVIKYGGQLQEVIAARYGEIGIPTFLVDGAALTEVDTALLASDQVAGIYLSGGKHSVYEDGAPQVSTDLLRLGKPIMASCYGEQALALALGGKVELGTNEELGRTTIQLFPTSEGSLLADLGETTIGLMSHRDVVSEVPAGAVVTARSPAGIAAFEIADRNIHAFQWHIESPQTPKGRVMFERFAKICGIEPSEEAANNYVAEALHLSEGVVIAAAREGFIQAFLSGGVDSAVATWHTYQILKAHGLEHRLRVTYVDTGSMRENDLGTIERLQAEGLPIEIVDRSELFLDTEIVLPELAAQELGYAKLPKLVDAKNGDMVRKIAKYGFLQVHEEIAARIRADFGDVKVFLLQGTNAADIAESLGEIKEHHNQGVEKYVDGEILPLRRLFKGQIRKAGRDLGLPDEITSRQPFPGPDLKIRVVPATEGFDRNSEAFLDTQSDVARYMSRISTRMSATVVPVRARGVRGDNKSDGFAVVMQTAEGSGIDWEELSEVSRTMGNEVITVNRVGYSPFSFDPSAAQNNVGLKRVRSTFRLLQVLETAKDRWLDELGVEQELSQHFMSLTDFSLDPRLSLRPTTWLRLFQSGGWGRKNEDMMTGVVAFPGIDGFMDYSQQLTHLGRRVIGIGAGGFVLDATSKPYGTTEWL